MQKLLWRNIVSADEAFHLVRVTWGKSLLPRHHCHDFAEIFWIDEGECVHHINGFTDDLQPGDIVFMRPADAHHFLPRGNEGFTFTNLAFPRRELESLSARFRKEVGELFPVSSATPVKRTLGRSAAAVHESVISLSEAPHTEFWLERFLLDLIGLILPGQYSPASSGAPDWLRTAVFQLREPEVFSGGVAEFVRISGRSHEHVTRLTRAHYGKTPAQLIIEARMGYAARALRLTSKSVTEIGMDCGYSKPSRFFKVFKEFHGTSPLQYRKALRTVV